MAKGERLPEIDWLRGVAALAVFAFHLAAMAGFDKRALPPFTLAGHRFVGVMSPLSLGASGVNLFFVISGFCLALQRLSRNGLWAPMPLATYARNRVARIVPAYWFAVVLSLPIAYLVDHEKLDVLAIDAAAHLAFLHGFSARTFLSLNGALWSMATEVQFYIFFPVLLFAYRRLGGTMFLAAVTLFDLVFRIAVSRIPAPADPMPILPSALLAYQLPGRVSEFAVGMWLAETYVRRPSLLRRWSPFAFAVAVPLGLYCRAFGPEYSPDLALAFAYAAVVAVVLAHVRANQSALKRFLDSWGASFGRASYSFFLIHYPVLVCSRALVPETSNPYARFALIGLISLPVSVALASLLYLLVELPTWRRFRVSATKTA